MATVTSKALVEDFDNVLGRLNHAVEAYEELRREPIVDENLWALIRLVFSQRDEVDRES